MVLGFAPVFITVAVAGVDIQIFRTLFRFLSTTLAFRFLSVFLVIHRYIKIQSVVYRACRSISYTSCVFLPERLRSFSATTGPMLPSSRKNYEGPPLLSGQDATTTRRPRRPSSPQRRPRRGVSPAYLRPSTGSARTDLRLPAARPAVAPTRPGPAPPTRTPTRTPTARQ